MNDGGPAFPRPPFTPGDLHDQLSQAGFVATGHPGMTLRDWFAGQVLVGLISKLPVIDQTGEFGCKVDDKIAYNDDVAESCYCIADAMLKAREGGAHE